MNLNNLSDKEKILIVEQLSNIKKAVANKYKWLNLAEETKETIYQEAIEDLLSYEKNINIETFSKALEKKLHQKYQDQITICFKNDTNNAFLELFTNNNLQIKSTPQENIQVLNKYIRLLQRLYYDISFESCLYLVENNSKVKNIIHSILYTANKLDTNKLENAFNTDLVFLIEPYCQSNDIDIYSLASEEDYSSLESKELSFDFDDEPSKKDDTILSNDIVRDYIRSLPSKLLSAEEEKKYFELLRKDSNEDIKKYIIEHNLRLVVKAAKKYLGQGIQFIDLIQEGNIGLIKAVERFDSTKGYKFSTYATWWIRQAITRSISNNGRSIRLPVYMIENINKISKAKKKLYELYGREPTSKELSEELNIPQKDLEQYLNYSQDTISINNVINEEEHSESQLQDFIADSSIDIENDYIAKDLKNAINPSLTKLTKREQFVLIKRFGLNNEEEKTLQEVGDMLHITRERVRQIENKALQKLRNDPKMKGNRNYLDNPTISKETKSPEKTTIFKAIFAKKSTILEAIDYLEEEEKEYLQSIFGPDYSKRVDKNLIADCNYLITKLNFFSRALLHKKNIKIIDVNLKELLNITDTEVLEKQIETLNVADQKIIHLKYNSDYTKTLRQLPLPVEHYFTKIIYPKIKSFANTTKTPRKTYQKRKKRLPKKIFEVAYSNLTSEEQKHIAKNYPYYNEKHIYYDNVKDKSKNDRILKKLLTFALNYYYTNNVNLSLNDATLSNLLGKDPIEIKYFCSKLSAEYINILIEYYGTDYIDHPVINSHISAQKLEILLTKIIPALKLALENFDQPLETQLNISKEKVLKAISYFPRMDQQLLHKHYNYSQEKDSSSLIISDYERLAEILLPNLKLVINDLENSSQISSLTKEKIKDISLSSKHKPAIKRFSVSALELQQIIASLEPKQKEIFYKKMGMDFTKPTPDIVLTKEENEFYQEVSHLISTKIIKHKRDLKNYPQIISLNTDINTFRNILKYFNKTDAKLLRIYYGITKKEESNLPPEEEKRLQQILIPLLKELIKEQQETSFISTDLKEKVASSSPQIRTINLLQELNTNQETLQNIISTLTPLEQQIFSKRIGFDYTKVPQRKNNLNPEEQKQYHNIIIKIKRKLNHNYHEKPQDVKIIAKIKNNPQIAKQASYYLTPQEEKIIIARLGTDYLTNPQNLTTTIDPTITKKVLKKLSFYMQIIKKEGSLETLEKKSFIIYIKNHQSALTNIEKYLNSSEKELLIHYFGQDYFTNPENNNPLEKSPSLTQLLQKITSLVKCPNYEIEKIENEKNKIIYYILTQKDAFIKTIDSLSSKEKELLKSLFGADYLTKPYNNINHQNDILNSYFIYNLSKLLTANINPQSIQRGKHFSLDDPNIQEILKNLGTEDKILFTKKVNGELMSAEEKIKYNKLARKISQKIFKKKKQNSKSITKTCTITEKFNCTIAELHLILDSLPNEEKNLFYQKNEILNDGQIIEHHLSKEETAKYNLVIFKIKRRLANYQEKGIIFLRPNYKYADFLPIKQVLGLTLEELLIIKSKLSPSNLVLFEQLYSLDNDKIKVNDINVSSNEYHKFLVEFNKLIKDQLLSRVQGEILEEEQLQKIYQNLDSDIKDLLPEDIKEILDSKLLKKETLNSNSSKQKYYQGLKMLLFLIKELKNNSSCKLEELQKKLLYLKNEA